MYEMHDLKQTNPLGVGVGVGPAELDPPSSFPQPAAEYMNRVASHSLELKS